MCPDIRSNVVALSMALDEHRTALESFDVLSAADFLRWYVRLMEDVECESSDLRDGCAYELLTDYYEKIYSSAIKSVSLPFEVVDDFPSGTVFEAIAEDSSLLQFLSKSLTWSYFHKGWWHMLLRKLGNVFMNFYRIDFDLSLRDDYLSFAPEWFNELDFRRGKYVVLAKEKGDSRFGWGFVVREKVARRVFSYLKGKGFDAMMFRVSYIADSRIRERWSFLLFLLPSSSFFFGGKRPVRYYDFGPSCYFFELGDVEDEEKTRYDIFALQWFTYRTVPFFRWYWKRFHRIHGLIPFSALVYGGIRGAKYGLQSAVDEYYDSLCSVGGMFSEISWRDLL